MTLASVTGVGTFGDWLEGLDRVGRRLYEVDAELWSEFEELHREFLRRVEHLDYEGQVSRGIAATRALAAQENEFVGSEAALEAILSRAQARLGPKVFRAQFERTPEASRRQRPG